MLRNQMIDKAFQNVGTNYNINENEEQNIYDEEAKQAEHMKILQDALSQKPKITDRYP